MIPISPRTSPAGRCSRALRVHVMAALLTALALPASLDAQIPQEEYATRRASLARMMSGDGVILVRGATAPAQDYMEFSQSPPLNYLAGIQEPDASLLIVKRGSTVNEILFVRERNPDREIWEGKFLGTKGASALTGMEARPREALNGVLDSLLQRGGTLFTTSTADMAGFPGSSGREWTPPEGTRAQPMIAELQRLRGTKSAAELQLIRRAVDITVEAHNEARRIVAPDRYEYEVEAIIEYTFRRNGAERPAFASIVGSGPNSTSLHYNQNDRQMKAGETIVIDIGANFHGYSADITRTLPVSGKFTPEQSLIYQTVRNAQAAAEAEARPGVSYTKLMAAAESELAAGLARAGLIDSANATYDCNRPGGCPQFRLYYMHGLGHGIGLQVHDPDQFQFGTIGVNSVFTIEPGIYVREDVLDHLPDTPGNRALRARLAPAVAKYANIGVRIEDDYIVGENGAEWISRVPRELSEVGG